MLQSVDEKEKTFTLTSEMKPNKAEWKRGSKFTCKSVHKDSKLEKSTNICDFCERSQPSIHVEIPSFQTVMESSSEVKATCLVQTAFEAVITWLVDGKALQNSEETSNTTHVFSAVTVRSETWKQVKKLTCKAEHPCFPVTEESVVVAGPPHGNPQVEISRSLTELLRGKPAELQCDITLLSSHDIYVTFQVNGMDVSSKEFVDLPKTPGPHSVSRKFSLPKKFWTSGSSFSCMVSHGFSSTPFRSNSINDLIVDPSVELFLVPTEKSGQKKLWCSAWGFNPLMKWFSESKEISSSSDLSMDGNGRVAVTSQLLVDETEWNSGKVFSCEVSDRSLEKRFRKNISLCSVTTASSQFVGVYVQGPSPAELLNKRHVSITCLLVAAHLSDFSITWKVDNIVSSRNVYVEQPVAHSNGTETLLGFLNVPVEDWLADKQVTCEGKHKCSNKGYEAHARKSRDFSPPAVTETLIKTIKHDVFVTYSEPSAILLRGSDEYVCLVSGFSPASINIAWFRDESEKLSNFSNSEIYKGPDGKFSIHSNLALSQVDTLPGVVISCRVQHGNTTLTLNTSKTAADMELCYFYANDMHANLNQEADGQTGYTAVIYLILFIISVIFTLIIVFIKTK